MGVLSIQILAPLNMRLRLGDGPSTTHLTEELRPGDTVIAVLRRLAGKYPTLVGTVLDNSCESVDAGVILVVDGRRVSGPRSLAVELAEDATMLLTTAVSGG